MGEVGRQRYRLMFEVSTGGLTIYESLVQSTARADPLHSVVSSRQSYETTWSRHNEVGRLYLGMFG
jgi:hypothetical protein